MTESSKAQRQGLAEDGDQPGQEAVEQVDGEDCFVRAQTFADEGLCVCVTHDGLFALAFTADQARKFAAQLCLVAHRVDEARAILAGENG